MLRVGWGTKEVHLRTGLEGLYVAPAVVGATRYGHGKHRRENVKWSQILNDTRHSYLTRRIFLSSLKPLKRPMNSRLMRYLEHWRLGGGEDETIY